MNKIKIFALVLGFVLLGLNVAGLFISLRNPAIYQERGVRDQDDITLTEEQLLEAGERRPEESTAAYIIRLNAAVNKGIAHYWEDEGIEKYNLRVPVYENYLLFIASYIDPQDYRKYEFFNHYKNIERGVGICSLHALVMAGMLKDHGVDSRVVLLNQHVVAMAQVNKERDKWWVVDPDLDVVVKHDMREIEADTDLIKPYYLEKGYEAGYVDFVAQLYGREGNAITRGVYDYLPWKLGCVEYLSYILKWAIPIILLALPALSYFRNKYLETKTSHAQQTLQPDFAREGSVSV
ncbi:MAG TPA: hypothetical protein VF553_14120 [Pyrinomonadaceae bacterium]|jgi:hypothetical protein